MEELKENTLSNTNQNTEMLSETQPLVSNDESGNTQQLSETTDCAASTESVGSLPTTPIEVEAENNAENEQKEPVIDYSSMDRSQLVCAFRELLDEDIAAIKDRVLQIRTQFNTLQKEIDKKEFEEFLANGGIKDEYQHRPDAIALDFNKAYNTYREKRQKHQEQQEQTKQHNYEQKLSILERLRAIIDKEDDESVKKTYDEFNAIQEEWKTIGEVPREKNNDLWQNYHFLIEQLFYKLNINRELRSLDQKRNLEQKIQLCEKAEELVLETSITKSFKEMQELRSQWKEIGPVPTEYNEEIWQRFCNAANRIDERRKEYYEQRKEELEKNLLAKQALVDKATELTENIPQTVKEWNETTEAIDELLKIWKTIGPVPHEVNEEIWTKFKGKVDHHYELKKEHFNSIRDEQSENYNKKIGLCLKAEAIAKRDDWKKATEELLQLQAEWKTIGSTSRKVSEKIWQRFRKACDEFFERKSAYYNTIKGSEQENLQKKETIIEQLRSHTFGEDKEENLRIIKDFQRQWMEIGHVPMSEKDRIQKEFRAIIDQYFEKLKINAKEAEESAYRERIKNISGEGKKFINDEKQTLLDKIEKIKSDLKLWENNLGFLANSKQADLLKQEFEKKMQNARQQKALLEAKLRILNENKTDKESDQDA